MKRSGDSFKQQQRRQQQDVVRLARLYGCGVSGVKKVSKTSKRRGNSSSAFSYTGEDYQKMHDKLSKSDFLISKGVEDLEGFQHLYITLNDLVDMFEKSYQLKFSSREVAAFVQESKCTELDEFREIRIVYNRVLTALKLLGNTLRSKNHSKVLKENEALLEFRKKHVEPMEAEAININLKPSTLFNALWAIHDACCEHWELKTKKFMEMLKSNFSHPSGVLDGDSLREFLWYNIDVKLNSEHCHMLILYINGLESRLESTISLHSLISALKLVAQDRQCGLTPPNDDEEFYERFCKEIQEMTKFLTNESRAARIANRTVKMAKRDENKRSKASLSGVRIQAEGQASNSALKGYGKMNSNNDDKSCSKNLSHSLEPIQQKPSELKTSNSSGRIDTVPSKHPSHAKQKEQRKISFQSGALPSCSKSLAPYVALSKDVAHPGGSNSILRAKTPLILDRPHNARDLASEMSPIENSGPAKGPKKTAKSSKKNKKKKNTRFELSPVQLDEKGMALRYELRYKALADFINVLSTTRKVSIDDIIQALWAKKQNEMGTGLDILSESGVLMDRSSFVEVIKAELPRLQDPNTLFSVLDPSRSGYAAVHELHALVSLFFLKRSSEAATIVATTLRCAAWEVLNCRMHRDASIKSTLSTADKPQTAAQMAIDGSKESNAASMRERELMVQLEANSRFSGDKLQHLQKRMEEEILNSLRDREATGDAVEHVSDEEREQRAIADTFLPPAILNGCLRAICTTAEAEKSCSLSTFILVKKCQAENLWDEDFATKHRGYSQEDVSVRLAIDYLSENEDEMVFLKEQFSSLQSKIKAYTPMKKTS